MASHPCLHTGTESTRCASSLPAPLCKGDVSVPWLRSHPQSAAGQTGASSFLRSQLLSAEEWTKCPLCVLQRGISAAHVHCKRFCVTVPEGASSGQKTHNLVFPLQGTSQPTSQKTASAQSTSSQEACCPAGPFKPGNTSSCPQKTHCSDAALEETITRSHALPRPLGLGTPREGRNNSHGWFQKVWTHDVVDSWALFLGLAYPQKNWRKHGAVSHSLPDAVFLECTVSCFAWGLLLGAFLLTMPHTSS